MRINNEIKNGEGRIVSIFPDEWHFRENVISVCKSSGFRKISVSELQEYAEQLKTVAHWLEEQISGRIIDDN